MFGLDERVSTLANDPSIAVVVALGILLGMRHATDPDHLAAVLTLTTTRRKQRAGAAARLGLVWGLGHGITLFVFGLPVLLLNQYLPVSIQRAAEVAIALTIVFLALRLLHRWRSGYFHHHEHVHEDGNRHAHLHSHLEGAGHEHHREAQARMPLGAFGIGLLHGTAGSAGVAVLLLASIDSRSLAVVALVLLAVFTAVSMSLLSTGFGLALASRPVRMAFTGIAPAVALSSLAFGVWYGLGAIAAVTYPF